MKMRGEEAEANPGAERGGQDEMRPMRSGARRPRKSAGDRIVAQARVRDTAQGNIAKLPTTRLERGENADGTPSLFAVFPPKDGDAPVKFELSFLYLVPGLVDLFAAGYLKWGISTANNSRRLVAGDLRRYWMEYLRENNFLDLVPTELDDQILAGFKNWLLQRKGESGHPIHPNTVRQALSSLRSVLGNAPASRHIAERIPAGPRGASRKTTPTEVLTFAQLAQVVAAAEVEILELSSRWERGRLLIEQGHRLKREGASLERNPKEREEAKSDENLALCLALIDENFPEVVPDLDGLKSSGIPLLGRTVDCAFGARHVAGFFYASSRDLVPLALYLAIDTVFNPDTLLGLQWSDIDRKVDRLGISTVKLSSKLGEEEDDQTERIEPLVKLTGTKGRANRRLTRLLDPSASEASEASLNLVLDLLEVMAARVRPTAEPRDADRVFLFVQQSLTKRPKGFGSDMYGGSNDTAWRHALAAFISDHQLGLLPVS